MRAPAGIELHSDGAWDCGSTGGEWSPGGCGCGSGGECSCGGSCGCKGEGGSCGGGSSGGGSKMPHLPDYDGQIWAKPPSQNASAKGWPSRELNLRSMSGATLMELAPTGPTTGTPSWCSGFTCSVHGIPMSGRKHSTRNAVCHSWDCEVCDDCDGPPDQSGCPPECLGLFPQVVAACGGVCFSSPECVDMAHIYAECQRAFGVARGVCPELDCSDDEEEDCPRWCLDMLETYKRMLKLCLHYYNTQFHGDKVKYWACVAKMFDVFGKTYFNKCMRQYKKCPPLPLPTVPGHQDPCDPPTAIELAFLARNNMMNEAFWGQTHCLWHCLGTGKYGHLLPGGNTFLLGVGWEIIEPVGFSVAGVEFTETLWGQLEDIFYYNVVGILCGLGGAASYEACWRCCCKGLDSELY